MKMPPLRTSVTTAPAMRRRLLNRGASLWASPRRAGDSPISIDFVRLVQDYRGEKGPPPAMYRAWLPACRIERIQGQQVDKEHRHGIPPGEGQLGPVTVGCQ